MSLPIWTADALRSEAVPWRGRAWRLVEAQNIIATRKLVDSIQEQEELDRIIEDSKPPVPPECRHLHWLLFTPFRYGLYPGGSRFRRAGRTPGVFYAAEKVETAVAEMVHYRLLFYRESPGLDPSDNAATYSAFAVAVKTPFSLDLTLPPFDAQHDAWTHPDNYGPCQALAETAREVEIEIILSRSVRDPAQGKNINILTCSAFEKASPVARQTWRIRCDNDGATAYCEAPRTALEFKA